MVLKKTVALLAVVLSAMCWQPGTGLSDGLRAEEPVTFEQHVRPLLRKHCVGCHKADHLGDQAVSGRLALDTFGSTIKGVQGGDARKVVVPGKSGESLLLAMLLQEDEDLRMPLDADPLSKDEIDLIRRWIDQGAKQGTAPATATVSSPRRSLRTLDVLIPISAMPPVDLLPEVTDRTLQLAVRIGPLAPVTALAYGRDGKQLWVGRYGRLSVWDSAAGTASAVLTASNSVLAGAVHDIAISPAGKLAAVAGGLPARKGQILLVDVESLEVRHVIEAHRDIVFAVAFSPDGKRLASCSFDTTVKLWDVSAEGTGEKAENKAQNEPSALRPPLSALLTLDAHSDFVYDVAFSPDAKLIASASKDRTVKLFDTAAGKSIRTLSGHNDDVLAVAFAPDGKHVVSAGNEPQLRWWKLEDGSVARRVGGHGGRVHHLEVSADRKLLLTASADKTLRVWDGSSGALKQTFAGASEWMYAATLSPDGAHVVGGSWDGLVRVWDASGGKLRATLLEPPSRVSTGPDYLVITPEGYYAASRMMSMVLRVRLGNHAVESRTLLALEDHEMISRTLSGQTVEVLKLSD